MQKPFISLFALAGVLLLNSCMEERPSNNKDYLIVGITSGMCSGDCATLFLLQDGKVYPDKETEYSFQQAAQPKFSASPLHDTTYQFAAGLLLAGFPDYLTLHPDTTLGCPDCRDQGGFHLIRMEAGVRRAWYIDPDTAALPVEIRGYVQQVSSAVYSL